MSDLIAKLRAELNEDERVARAAVNWSYGAQQWADSGEPDWTHIARHDPARVLRQTAAIRKLLDEHERLVEANSSDRADLAERAALWRVMRFLAEALGIEP